MGFAVYQEAEAWYWTLSDEGGRVIVSQQGPFPTRDDAAASIASTAATLSTEGAATPSNAGPAPATPERPTGLLARVPVPVWVAAAGVLGTVLGAVLGAWLTSNTTIRVKALEFAFMGSPTVGELQSRITTLRVLFPNELGGWATPATAPSPDPACGGGRSGNDSCMEGSLALDAEWLWPTANVARWEFFNQAMTKVECPQQVVELWAGLFGPTRVRDEPEPGHEWIEGFSIGPCP